MSERISIIPQTPADGRDRTAGLGSHGETLAANLLEREGYRIVMSNFKAPVGRNSRGVQVTGEIDLIALDGDTLCFIEVKSRTSDTFAGPLANVNLRKQRQITRTAKVYKQLFALQDTPHRFDVVTVLAEKGTAPRLELLRGFWTEAKFKKRPWNDVPY
jgi:putative endonuclease